jgi:hypothetical protein
MLWLRLVTILAVAKSSSHSRDIGNTVERMDDVTITARDASALGFGRKAEERLCGNPKNRFAC